MRFDLDRSIIDEADGRPIVSNSYLLSPELTAWKVSLAFCTSQRSLFTTHSETARHCQARIHRHTDTHTRTRAHTNTRDSHGFTVLGGWDMEGRELREERTDVHAVQKDVKKESTGV